MEQNQIFVRENVIQFDRPEDIQLQWVVGIVRSLVFLFVGSALCAVAINGILIPKNFIASGIAAATEVSFIAKRVLSSAS